MIEISKHPVGGAMVQMTNTPRVFDSYAHALYRYQVKENPIYRAYVRALGLEDLPLSCAEAIPCLPIACYRGESLVSTGSWEPELIFESSGTTASRPSRHAIADLSFYEKQAVHAFEHHHTSSLRGQVILALLPHHLSKSNNSLVCMLRAFMRQSGHPSCGFFLHDHEGLADRIRGIGKHNMPKQLWGSPQALLDFFSTYQDLDLKGFTIFHTGGIKATSTPHSFVGLEGVLRDLALVVPCLRAEYGMTELLSQAYTPPTTMHASISTPYSFPSWVRVYVSDPEDPLGPALPAGQAGRLQIIDLSARAGCAFLGTDDIGVCLQDGTFLLQGRIQGAPAKGCHHLYEAAA